MHPATDNRPTGRLISKPALFRASDLALAASDNLIVSRACQGRSPVRAALYLNEAQSALETALALLTTANDGEPDRTPPAAAMAVCA